MLAAGEDTQRKLTLKSDWAFYLMGSFTDADLTRRTKMDAGKWLGESGCEIGTYVNW